MNNVADSLSIIISNLQTRSLMHDITKLEPPELEYFDKYTPMLKHLEYGSDEYKQALNDLKPALDHHYKHNAHHPEHYKNGIDGMNIVDIVEMFCDWYAAGKRMKDGGDIIKSIDISAKRFGICPQLVNILKNSIDIIKD